MKEAGVAAIPVSAFYEDDPVTSIVRLCFSKRDETLDEGIAAAGQGAGSIHPGSNSAEPVAAGRHAELRA